MEYLLITFLNGVSYGLLLFMLSSGLTLIFGMMGVLNFAHASFYMMGAYFAYQLSQTFGFWVALILAPILVGLAGALVERLGLRHVHKLGHVHELLFTFGLTYIVVELVQLAWGLSAVSYQVPAELSGSLFTLYTTTFPAYRGFMMLVAVLMIVILHFVLTRTRIGLVIQASLSHPDMVGALGHNVPRIFLLVFGGGCALAGLAGVIGGNAFVTEPGMAAALGPIIFVIVVIGGMGSLFGAFYASLLIGLIQTFAVGMKYSLVSILDVIGVHVTPSFFGFPVLSLTIAEAAPMIPYILLIVVLIFRPKGLMGNRES